MKRTEPQSLRAVLEEAVRECDMEQELLRTRAQALWPRIVGKEIASRCGRPFCRADIMTIPVQNASLRHELSMMRSSMIKAINTTLRADVISEIRFVGLNNR